MLIVNRSNDQVTFNTVVPTPEPIIEHTIERELNVILKKAS